MGNLLVNIKRGVPEIRLPKASYPILVRSPDAKILSEETKKRIEYVVREWEGAGFKFTTCEFTLNDRANEISQEREAQDRELHTRQPIDPQERSTYTERNLYIDFLRATPGRAYQLNWQSNFQPDESTYISIGPREGLLHSDLLHEAGHVLGLAHEHQRCDRDNYVEPIDSESYKRELSQGQQIGLDSVGSIPFGPYDPNSIMHYPATFKLKAEGMLIGGKPSQPQFPVKLTLGDMMTARFLYNEARIKEYLNGLISRPSGEEYLGIADAYKPVAAQATVGGEPEYAGYNRGYSTKAEIDAAQGEIELQNGRLQALLKPYQGRSVISKELIIRTTHEAITNQLEQLRCLKVNNSQKTDCDITWQDERLLKWSTGNMGRFEKEGKTNIDLQTRMMAGRA